MKITKLQQQFIKDLQAKMGSMGIHCSIKERFPELFKETELEDLINEAKKRGLKEGVTIVDARDGRIETISNNYYRLQNICDDYGKELIVSADSFNYTVLFSKGKWATILQTITKEEAEKKLGKIIKD